MTLAANTFLGAFGFSENPFTMTNADDEPELQSYFVPPPYFTSVLGEPIKAKSAVVFAPRGGGKTAQKVMIEKAARSGDVGSFLCITYDTFLLPADFSIDGAKAEWHLTNIVKLVIVALLLTCDDDHDSAQKLSEEQKNALAKTATHFLSSLTEAEFRQNISALRNWRGNADHYWEKYGGKIAALITAVIAKYGLGSVDKIAEAAALSKSSIADYMHQLVGIAKSLGFKSIYVLVDRIDETSLTSNNARAAFDFIKSILIDLHVLEMDGVAYKFFLWDKVKDFYLSEGARPDRVPIHELDWTPEQLSEMLSKRLATFSDGRITSLNDLTSEDVELDVQKLICLLSAGSPRDMIRMSQKMIDEQTKSSNMPGKISLSVLDSSLRLFANERALELYPQFVGDLKRLGLASFTITKISSDVYRVTTQAGRSKVQKWQEWGAVSQTGEAPNAGNRPHYVYSLTDPRLVFAAKGNQSLRKTLEDCFVLCDCGELNITEQDEPHCTACGRQMDRNHNLLSAVLNTPPTAS